MSGESSAIILRVNPEQLIAVSDQVTAKITSAKRAFGELSETAESTVNFWLGKAGDTYRKLFSEGKPAMEEVFARFSEHATDLKVIGAKYAGQEAEIKTIIQESLPADVIE